jgi:hypothetical protein
MEPSPKPKIMPHVLLISSTSPPVTGGSAVAHENIGRNADGQFAGQF